MPARQTPRRDAALKQATYEALTRKKPVEKDVLILLDPKLADDLDKARTALSVAQARVRLAGDADRAQAQADADAALVRVADARDAAAEATVVMTFQAIGRLAFDDLISHHPPTPEQKEKNFGWNPDTFGPAVISASLVDPKLSVDEVNTLLASPGWNNAESLELHNTAIEVNNSRRTADLGKD